MLVLALERDSAAEAGGPRRRVVTGVRVSLWLAGQV